MAFLKNVNQMQKANFGLKHLWDIKFIDPVLIGPFSEWFPATEINLELFNVNSYQIKTNIGTVSIPANKVVGDNQFTATFYDDERGSVEAWLEDWVEHAMFYKSNDHNYTVVGTLDECARLVEIQRLNTMKEEIRVQLTDKLWTRKVAVYPEGSLSYIGESEVGIHTYTLNFKIVGYVNPDHY